MYKGCLLFFQIQAWLYPRLAKFFTTSYGYMYKYVLPGIVQNLAKIVIKLHITQKALRSYRRWGWLSLTDLPMIGTRLCCQVASFCKHNNGVCEVFIHDTMIYILIFSSTLESRALYLQFSVTEWLRQNCLIPLNSVSYFDWQRRH